MRDKRSVRRLASILTIVGMLLSLAAPAFAGPFSDVPDTHTYATAINRLAGLGVVEGVGGGKYDPDSAFTRAQFAALIVKSMGLKAAAQASAGPTQFSDVPSDHWATGYINVASTMGIVNGFPDGTFQPDANVTHAQALAMILRALGYEPALKGSWPMKYLVKAAELGISDGVNVVAGLPATRAEVAKFVDNALDVPLLEQVSYGDRVEYKQAVDSSGKPTKSLLRTYLAKQVTEPVVEGWLISSPEALNTAKDEKNVGIDTNNDGVADKSLELLSGTAYAGLLGHKVKAWKNKDGKVFFLEDVTEAANIKTVSANDIETETVSGDVYVTKVKAGGTWYELVDLDSSTSAPGRQVLYVKNLQLQKSNVKKDDVDEKIDMDNGKFTAILDDDGKVRAIVVAKHHRAIVDEANAANQSITCTSDFTGCPGSLKDKAVTWVGAAKAVGELQEGDVLEWLLLGDKFHIVVTRNNKTGTLDRLTGDGVRVAGSDYDFAPGYSTSDTALLGKTVTAYLDRFGKVVMVKSGTVAGGPEAKPVAAITKEPYSVSGAEGVTWYLRVLKSDGSVAYLPIAKDATVDTNGDRINDVWAVSGAVYGFNPDWSNVSSVLWNSNVQILNIIEYSLNSAGKIDHITVLADVYHNGQNCTNITTDSDGTCGDVTGSKDPNRVTVSSEAVGFDGTTSGTYALTSSTVVFDLSETIDSVYDPDKAKTVSPSTIAGAGTFKGLVVRDKDNTANARVVVVFDPLSVGAVTDHYGLVMGKYTTSGPKYYLSVNESGTTTDYEVESTHYSTYNRDMAIRFGIVSNKLTPKGEFTVADSTHMKTDPKDAAHKAKVWRVDASAGAIYVDVDGDGLWTQDDKSFLVNSTADPKTQYFNLNGDSPATAIGLSDILAGDAVTVYVDTNQNVANVARVVVINR